jgi:glycerol kinase
MTCLLAIDQSTSATKVLLLDCTGEVLEEATRPHKQFYPRPGWVEHDAQEIWQNLLDATAEVLAGPRAAGASPAGISIANQRETIVIFQRGSGRPLCPAIVWQCRRGEALCTWHRELGHEPEVRKRSGLRIDSYFTGSKLQWLVRERPDLAAALERGDALVGTMDTYLIHRLTRGAVFATDPTNACRTLLYDIGRLAWSEKLCEWWQLPRTALAEVRASDAQFGETDLEGRLAAPVPIRGVMGDSQAAMFAQQCLEVGSAKVTFGTGSSVLLNAGRQRPRSLDSAVTTLAWVQGTVPTYALEGIITSAAATLVWLRDRLGILADPAESASLAADSSDDESVYLVPAFSGLGAPWWSDKARAAIVGLSAHSERRHIVRAALESIAFQLRDVLEMMRREAGVELREIRADGGPTGNAFLMQLVADIVGIDVLVASRADRAARGAALMGCVGAGVPVQLEQFTGTAEKRIYRRRMTAQQSDERYRGWLRAVRQVLSGVT